ncbi:MAG: glutaredoxin family protein [Pseudomonadota bacterium]|nr:glutaredoxin family protein [Pseudomonadota bacterium]
MNTPSLTLISRRDCLLCDEMLAALREFGVATPLPPLRQIDVDSDPELTRRYGLQVPVLLLGETLVCRFRFDPAALNRHLGAG